MKWAQERPAIPVWRLRPEALDDPVFRDEVGTGITQYFLENEGTASTTAMEWDAFKVVVRGICITNMVGVRKIIIASYIIESYGLRGATWMNSWRTLRYRH